MDQDRLGDLITDILQRVKRRHRLLEHHRDIVAAQVAEFQSQAVDAGRGELGVYHMKTLPLDDMNAAIEMAAEYKDAGVTHLVHTQAYDSPSQFKEVLDQVDSQIRSKL